MRTGYRWEEVLQGADLPRYQVQGTCVVITYLFVCLSSDYQELIYPGIRYKVPVWLLSFCVFIFRLLPWADLPRYQVQGTCVVIIFLCVYLQIITMSWSPQVSGTMYLCGYYLFVCLSSDYYHELISPGIRYKVPVWLLSFCVFIFRLLPWADLPRYQVQGTCVVIIFLCVYQIITRSWSPQVSGTRYLGGYYLFVCLSSDYQKLISPGMAMWAVIAYPA